MRRSAGGLTTFSPTRLSRPLRSLPDIGVIKRVSRTYRYGLTKPSRAATAAAAHLTEATMIPVSILRDVCPGASLRRMRQEFAGKGLNRRSRNQ